MPTSTSSSFLCRNIRYSFLMILVALCVPLKAEEDIYTSTKQSQLNVFEEFIESGKLRNRDLRNAISKSDWTLEEIRLSITKIYQIDSSSMVTFLDSPKGKLFLRNKTKKYFIGLDQRSKILSKIRSAIILDSRDGYISTRGIIKNFPESMLTIRKYKCQASSDCINSLSFYLFLPACLQAAYKDSPPISHAYKKYCQ